MPTGLIQRSFAGGILSPPLAARADTAKYSSGLRQCSNCIIQRHGAVANRAGTQFVCEVKDSTKAVRLQSFVFNADQAYVLEFGDLYMRIIVDGAQLIVTGLTAWSGATNYIQGDLVLRTGVNYYALLPSLNKDPVTEPTYWYPLTQYTASPLSSIFEIQTPYTEAELFELQFAQSNDVMTVVHQSHPPHNLQRVGATDWILFPITFLPSIDPPTNMQATQGAAGAFTFRYKVTAVKEETYEESLTGTSGSSTACAITGSSTGSPHADLTVTTAGAHGLITGDEVTIVDGGIWAPIIEGKPFIITVINTTTFTLDGTDELIPPGTPFISDTTCSYAPPFAEVLTAAKPTEADPITVTWNAVVNAHEYWIYKEKNGVFGYLGNAIGTTFLDEGLPPTFEETPPQFKNPFDSVDNYPATVAFYQQRQCYARTNNDPQKVWISRTGNFNNFTIRSPLQDDDPVFFTIAGQQVNEIRHLVTLEELLILTQGAEWLALGDQDGVLRPDAVNLKPQGYNGSSGVSPLVIANNMIFAQARRSTVFDANFDVGGRMQTRDLTIFAPDLFSGHSIIEWGFANIPHSILWTIRDDGALLGITYLREHDIWAWHQHETTAGLFESVAVIPQGDRDVPYFVVQRTIDSLSVRYIEFLHERLAGETAFDITTDAFFVDSGLTYDGHNTTAITLTLSGGAPWTAGSTLTLTASAALFAAGDVSDAFRLRASGDTVDVLVTAFTSSTVVTVEALADVPVSLQAAATVDWSHLLVDIFGLDHLLETDVAYVADGHSATGLVEDTGITGGKLTIDAFAEVVHIGLPIVAQIETLPIDNPQSGDAIADRRKDAPHLTIYFQDSRAVQAGHDETLLLYVDKGTAEEDPLAADARILNGKEDARARSNWNMDRTVLIRQSDSLPMGILGLVLDTRIGGR